MQAQNSYLSIAPEAKYFFSLDFGYQMSGIKDEDFVSSNYSPLINISAGNWIFPYLAIQLGYKGFYFNTIADREKHNYNYIYLEVLINVNNLLLPKRINKNWEIIIHGGGGYFYNHRYGKPNICANIGLQNSLQLLNSMRLNIDVSSIIGWDLYQGNLDILPGITIGLRYNFNSD